MKKFVTTILLRLLSLVCVFAFTACNEKPEEKFPETRTTVTEEQWVAAFGFITDNKTNFSSVYLTRDLGGFGSEVEIILSIDKLNKIVYFKATPVENGIYDEENSHEIYCWGEADGKYFLYGSLDGGEKIETDKEGFEVLLQQYIEIFAMCDEYYENNDIAERYNEFTYREENKTYVFYEDSDIGAEFLFENEKIVKANVSSEGSGSGTIEYKYDTIVVVPQTILDMPATEI